MVPSYDFDIQWLIPREVTADPAINKLFGDIGINGNARGSYIALFRDPRVIAKIERGDPVLRAYLKASGFGFIEYQSGAPAGFFPAVDVTARTDVIARLDKNLAQFDLKGADLGGFDFGAFLDAIVEGKPLPSKEAEADRPIAPATAPAASEHDFLSMPLGFAKLSGRNRVLPLMVLSLAATLGAYWLIQHIETASTAF